jgi:4-hydroxy-2-oxoheptanedioate aldolase
MRENRIRTIWQQGGAVINGWLHIPSSWSAEVMAHAGWDSLTIDMQHGLTDYSTAVPMLQAISTTHVIPMARVWWNEPGIIMKMLDAGCYGIICPMINTRAEAEKFVAACRYAPQGNRSHGPTRATLYAGSDYIPNANAQIITMAMIETEQAVQNLDAILSVPGLDAIYVGPADLSMSYGYPPSADLKDPKLVGIIDDILAGCKRHGVVAGIHVASVDYAVQSIEKGFQFITILADTRLLAAAANQAVSAVRNQKPAAAPTGPY